MNCRKCGNEIKEGSQFCVNCGSKIVNKNKFSNKKILLFSCVFIVLIIILIIFLLIKSRNKLSWDESYLSNDVKIVTQSNLKLRVKIKGNQNDNITYTTTCGDITSNNLEVIWNLTESNGKCEITAKYKGSSIKKELNVTPINLDNQELSLEDNLVLNDEDDYDLDGLTNKKKKEYNTNPKNMDSDMDGLDDYYEIFSSKTDPNKKDTDNDGLSDYDEIELGLNPNMEDSNDDGVKDGKRLLEYSVESENFKLSISGYGNIASSVVDINVGTNISNKIGLIDNLYTLYSDGKIDEATLIISYTDEEIEKNNLNEDNLSIYYYNVKENKYEKVNSVVDKENKTVTAKLNHFSHYVLGDSSLINESNITQILFILDNSWSLYTNEQYELYTGKEYFGGYFNPSDLDGFDPDGVRFGLTSDLITKLSKNNYQIGLSEFRYDYANIYPIGSNYNDIQDKLSNMMGNFVTKYEGTNIYNSLDKGIKEFSDDNYNKYIVILTDGADSNLTVNTNKIIESATKNNVKICSIGFGSGTYNTNLANISNSTGCNFFSSSDVSGLSELFNNIEVELEDSLIDIDDDGNNDGILIADSGFVVNRDGFSFKNYGTNLSKGGHCYGMATFAELYYRGVLPLKVNSKKTLRSKSYEYDLSNTYFSKNLSLYDYKFKTNALKYTFGYELFNEESPSDFRELSGSIYKIKDEYKNNILQTGFYDLETIDVTKPKDEQIKLYGFTFDRAEVPYLNEDKTQNSTVIDNEDLQLFNAIYTSYIKQFNMEFYSSSMNGLLWARGLLMTESVWYWDGNAFLNILKSRMNDKDAPVISSNFNGGLHAINAISLIQDINNPNIYYIGVYDNNYPGEKRYVEIE